MSGRPPAQPSGQRPSSVPPVRRKAHPSAPGTKKYNPEGHLGLPTKERLAKSNGFEEVNLAPGDGPKVPRAAEKMPFTPQAIRIRLVAEEIERAGQQSRAPDPRRKLTPVDKMLEEHEFAALDWYTHVAYRYATGRPTMMRYVDTRLPPEEREDDDKNEPLWRVDFERLRIVDVLLHEAAKEFLSLIIWQMYPDFKDGVPPTQQEMGQMILGITGKDSTIGGFRGYLRCVAQYVSSALGEADVIRRRRRDKRDLQVRQDRKAQASLHFKTA